MSKSDNPANSGAIPSQPTLGPATGLALLITAIVTAVAVACLQFSGERIFDEILAAIGKKLFLQVILVLLAILSYCFYLLVKNSRRLSWRRCLYWAKTDQTPFCPVCYETKGLRVHLNTISFRAECDQAYSCGTCKNVYFAESLAKDFQKVD